MNSIEMEKPIGKTNKNYMSDQSSLPDCKFEISQAETTFKLRRFNNHDSFKITLKPFVGQNSRNDSKKSSSKPKKDSQSNLKRSLIEVLSQSETNNRSTSVGYGSETQIQKIEGNTVQLRKSLRNMRKNTKNTKNIKNIKKETSLPPNILTINETNHELPLISENAEFPVFRDFQIKERVFEKKATLFRSKPTSFQMKFEEEVNPRKIEENKKLFFDSYKEEGEEDKKKII